MATLAPERPRDAAKHARRTAILDASTLLFASRGYAGVSLEDIGAAVGISGPALYRHFSSKQALVGAVLIRVSEGLLAGGEAIEGDSPRETLKQLVNFHVAFAQQDSAVIRVHERELPSLSMADQQHVRQLQRSYVGRWIRTLEPLIDAPRDELRLRVQATIGLINSTPHSTDSSSRTGLRAATLLREMALAALFAGADLT